MTIRRDAAPGGWGQVRVLVRALRALAIAAALAIAPSAQERSLAAGLGAVGLLWTPEGEAPSAPMPMVIALHDLAGVDSRGWHYGDQITAASIAVLHVELLETSADGFTVGLDGDDATAARARLATVMARVAEDPRFAGAPFGLLALGGTGDAALRAAADPAHGYRIAGLALLYPGCAALAAGPGTPRPRSPVLLLHGDADPANLTADCMALADSLNRPDEGEKR